MSDKTQQEKFNDIPNTNDKNEEEIVLKIEFDDEPEIKAVDKNQLDVIDDVVDTKDTKKDIVIDLDDTIESSTTKSTIEFTENTEKNQTTENTDDQDNNENDIPFIDPSVYTYKKKKSVKKYVIAGIVGLLAVFYFSGVLYFNLHFGTYTTINGYNVSGYTIDEVEQLIIKDLNAYEVTIRFKNGEEKISNGDGSLNINTSASVKHIKSQTNPFLWFIGLNEEKDYTLEFVVEYDKESMKSYLSQSPFMDESKMIDSTDAKVVMEEGKVLVVPDVTGTRLDKEKVYETVFNTLDNGDIIVSLEESDCYIPANITVDSEIIQKSAENAEAFLSIEANYDFLGNIYTIPKEDLCSMGYLAEDGTVKLSKTNIEMYARDFAEKYTTVDKKRKFRTHDGKLIYIQGEDGYGWELDPEQEAIELYDYMCKMESFTKKPATIQEGYAFWELNDIGGSYVEVDLADQRVYVYQDGLRIYETPCVSGYPDWLHNTPAGLYDITYKDTYVKLRGEDYESPVTYWMPFNGDIGLHDATWRTEDNYTPDRYTWDGSHGCVNLPFAAAARIYELVEAGSPVVCYWDDEVEYVPADEQ
ncbi:MAG: L,D-transpeptidase [Lachnospiraceae bacterium]|nr:L,D-transpeptidase [Lachnospiraceae bacterium]